MFLEFIKTGVGELVLEQLKSEGWKVKSQYSPFAFDKGIDFDSYELNFKGSTLVFEWDNWFEWKITGPEELLIKIKKQYSLD